jgi:hypothetical protein
MLDGQRYFEEFPDEGSGTPRKLLLSEELRVTLAAIEKELSAFIRGAGQDDASVCADDESVTSRDSAET